MAGDFSFIDPNLIGGSNYGAQQPTQPAFNWGTPDPVSRAPQQSPKNKLLSSFLTPEALAALTSGGLGVASALLSNNAAGDRNEAQLAVERERIAQAGNIARAGVEGDALTDLRTRQLEYLNSLQMDPVAQQRHLFRANILRDMASAGPPVAGGGRGVTNPMTPSPYTMGFLAPDALAENASRFYAAAGSIDPNQQRPDLAGMGFGEAGANRQQLVDQTIDNSQEMQNDLLTRRRDALAGQVTGTGTQPAGATPTGNQVGAPHPSDPRYVMGPNGSYITHEALNQLINPKKRPWWHKALIGAGLVGSAFIPGLSAAVAPYLISAGTGMALGGVSGALSGAASTGMNQANDYFNRRAG